MSRFREFRELLDEVLGDMIWDDPRPAAEAVAESLGLYAEREGERVEVYVDGQQPACGWGRVLRLGFRGMWAAGAVVSVSEDYEPGHFLIPMEVQYW